MSSKKERKPDLSPEDREIEKRVDELMSSTQKDPEETKASEVSDQSSELPTLEERTQAGTTAPILPKTSTRIPITTGKKISVIHHEDTAVEPESEEPVATAPEVTAREEIPAENIAEAPEPEINPADVTDHPAATSEEEVLPEATAPESANSGEAEPETEEDDAQLNETDDTEQPEPTPEVNPSNLDKFRPMTDVVPHAPEVVVESPETDKAVDEIAHEESDTSWRWLTRS